MSSPHQKPLDWIHLELIPLPDRAPEYIKSVVWWNPQTGELLGEHSDLVLNLVNDQLQHGSVSSTLGVIELTDPLTKPTELAAILGQFFWVVPQPVAHAYESAGTEISGSAESNSSTLQ